MNLLQIISILRNAWTRYWSTKNEDELRKARTDLQIEKEKIQLTDAKVRSIRARTDLTYAQAGLVRTKAARDKIGGGNNASTD